ANTKVESDERRVVTTFSIGYLVRISSERVCHDDFMRVLYSNRSRGRLSLQFYVRFFFISVERRARTTFSIGYLVRISRESEIEDDLELIFKVEMVEREVLTTFLFEYLVRIGREEGCHYSFM